MDLDEIGEFGLLEKIRRKIRQRSNHVKLGLGDDCAVVASSDRDLLTSTDILIENVHFDLKYFSPEMIGKKAIAVNLSDIAAMGGRPLYILISLGIPSSTRVKFVEKLYIGFETMAKKYGCSIVGGDISKSIDGLIVSITIFGEIKKNASIKRSGAKNKDLIFVTGNLGDSAAGLDSLKKSHHSKKNIAIKKHLCPIPRLEESQVLAEKTGVSSMIDLSDGLASDLKRVCAESNCGARIYLNKIPLSSHLRKLAKSGDRKVIDYALYGGEDYELLFTIKKSKIKELQKSWQKMKTAITNIGEILDKKHGITLVYPDGKEELLTKMGHNHFKKN